MRVQGTTPSLLHSQASEAGVLSSPSYIYLQTSCLWMIQSNEMIPSYHFLFLGTPRRSAGQGIGSLMMNCFHIDRWFETMGSHMPAWTIAESVPASCSAMMSYDGEECIYTLASSVGTLSTIKFLFNFNKGNKTLSSTHSHCSILKTELQLDPRRVP